MKRFIFIIAITCSLMSQTAYAKGLDVTKDQQIRFFASWALHTTTMGWFESRWGMSKRWAWITSTLLTSGVSLAHDQFLDSNNGMNWNNQYATGTGILTSTLFKVTLKW